MSKVIDVRELQSLGLLGIKYTKLDLCDAFLMFCISNKVGIDQVVLRDNNKVINTDNYFHMGSYSFCADSDV